MKEAKNDLELKSSGAQASEECIKDQVSYLEKRINDLEAELEEKAKTIDNQELEIKNLAGTDSAGVEKLEKELKEKIEALSESQNEIEKLRQELETSKEKDSEILRLNEKENLINERLHQLEKGFNEKSDSLVKKELELTSLQNVLSSIEGEFNTLQTTCDEQINILAEKTSFNQQLQGRLDEQQNDITVLRLELERFESSVKDSDVSIMKSREIEDSLKNQIAELLESKVKLETEFNAKDLAINEIQTKLASSQKEVDERGKCIAGLEAEVASVQKIVAERESAIEKWTKDFNDLKDTSKKAIQDLELSKQTISNEAYAAKSKLEETLDKLKADHQNEILNLNSKTDELSKIVKEKDAMIEKTDKNATLLNELKESLDEKLAAKDNEMKELTSKLNKTERDDAEKVSFRICFLRHCVSSNSHFFYRLHKLRSSTSLTKSFRRSLTKP